MDSILFFTLIGVFFSTHVFIRSNPCICVKLWIILCAIEFSSWFCLLPLPLKSLIILRIFDNAKTIDGSGNIKLGKVHTCRFDFCAYWIIAYYFHNSWLPNLMKTKAATWVSDSFCHCSIGCLIAFFFFVHYNIKLLSIFFALNGKFNFLYTIF